MIIFTFITIAVVLTLFIFTVFRMENYGADVLGIITVGALAILLFTSFFTWGEYKTIDHDVEEYLTVKTIVLQPFNPRIVPMVTQDMKFLGEELIIEEQIQYNLYGVKTRPSFEIKIKKSKRNKEEVEKDLRNFQI